MSIKPGLQSQAAFKIIKESIFTGADTEIQLVERREGFRIENSEGSTLTLCKLGSFYGQRKE